MIADLLLPYIAKLPATDSPSAVGWVLIILFSLAAGTLSLLKLVEYIRGRKPEAADLQTFTTKAEHFALCKRVSKMEEEHTFQTIATQRALGRIEGELKILNNKKEDSSNKHSPCCKQSA